MPPARRRRCACSFAGCAATVEGGGAPHARCRLCGGRPFCPAHRLPEDHACEGYGAMVEGKRAGLKRKLEEEAGGVSHHEAPRV